MTKKDKKLVADYMCWNKMTYLEIKNEELIYHTFDLNDAGLVVQEMQKRGEWEDFHDYVDNIDMMSKASFSYVTAWLMSMEDGQAKNFFKAFVEWRKGK